MESESRGMFSKWKWGWEKTHPVGIFEVHVAGFDTGWGDHCGH